MKTNPNSPYTSAGGSPPGQSGVPAPSLADIQAQAQAAGNSAMSGFSSSYSPGGQVPDDGNIFLGNTPVSLTGQGRDIAHGTINENIVPYGEARLLPSIWANSDPDQLKKLVTTGILNKVPGFSVGMGLPEITAAWDKLISASFDMNQTANPNAKHWTPWDVLNTYANPDNKFGTVRQGDWLYDASTGAKVKYVGPKTKTTMNRNINLSSSEDVRALTTQVLTQALGRAPTDKEVAQYKATINSQESANPTITTSTQTLDNMGQPVAQSNKTTGGFSSTAAAQMVQDQAAQSQEYGKYQSATTYWNAMMQMLTGSATSGG